MLKGSRKERLMQQVAIRTDEEICLSIFHNGVKIGEKVIAVLGVEMHFPDDPKKEITSDIRLEIY